MEAWGGSRGSWGRPGSLLAAFGPPKLKKYRKSWLYVYMLSDRMLSEKEPKKSYKRKHDLNETVTGVKKRQKLNLDSMNQLYSQIIENKNENLKNILDNCTLVGIVNSTKILVQFEVQF